MKKMLFVALAAALLFAGSRSTAVLASVEQDHYFGFEESLKPWVAAANDGVVDKATLTLQTEKLQGGDINRYALLSHNAGNVVWMKTTFTTSAHKIRVEFLAKDATTCGACVAMVYVGRRAPQYPGEFTASYNGLSKDWGYEGFDFTLDNDAFGLSTNMVVAIGFTGLELRDGGQLQQMAVDNLHVTIMDATTK